MSWNYRVIQNYYDDGDTFAVHEVYYDDVDGHPKSWSTDSIAAHGESLDELRDDLARMTQALSKAVMTVVTLDDGGEVLREI